MKRYLLKRYIKEAAISWLQPLAGFVTADAHDAAFAIYTSGTTGNPKGVLLNTEIWSGRSNRSV